MRTPKSAVLTATVIGVCVVSLARGQDATRDSPQLEVLARFVGDWHGTTVFTGANGDEKTFENDATMKRVLGGSYVEDKVGDRLYGLWTYDRSQNAYRCWYFAEGSSEPLAFTMQWNEADSSFSGSGAFDNGVTVETTHRFVGSDKLEFSAVAKNASGEIIGNLRGSKTRK